MRPRICHAARDIRRTGGGEVVRQLARAMDEAGAEVTIITDTPRSALPDVPSAVHVVPTLFGGRLLAWRPTRRAGWHVRHALQIAAFSIFGSIAARRMQRRGWVVVNHNCEVVVGDVVVMHNVFTAELRRRQLSPVRLGIAFANPTRLMRLLKERLLALPHRARTFVAVSELALPDIVELTRGRQQAVVIGNAVDGARFRPASSAERRRRREDLEISNDVTAVAFIGHEFKRKGLPELLEAMTLLPEDFQLFVAGGESQNLREYTTRAAELGISPRVHFLGTVNDVPAFLQAVDVFCLASHYETFGMVAAEALATGVPVVLSENCPIEELLRPGVNGYACTLEPSDIADQIRRAAALNTSPADIRSTVNGRTWEVAAGQYLHLAQQLLPTG